MDDQELSFDSYNAMGRTASYAGVPQFVILGIVVFAILFTGLSCFIFGWFGLIAIVVPVAMFFIVRIICETDSRFLTRLGFMLRRYIRNMVFGRAQLITPYNPRWNQFYGRRIAQERYITRKSGSVDELPRS